LKESREAWKLRKKMDPQRRSERSEGGVLLLHAQHGHQHDAFLTFGVTLIASAHRSSLILRHRLVNVVNVRFLKVRTILLNFRTKLHNQ
jgi:hypothetical protein